VGSEMCIRDRTPASSNSEDICAKSVPGQYWRVDKLKSYGEFLERRFPESRRKACYLMSIHEHLPVAKGNALYTVS